jgi:glucuronyl/N-acetylglucosaminyl transferase EXT2
MNASKNDRFRLVVMGTNHKLTAPSNRQCGTLLFVVCVALLLTVISFLSAIILSTFSADTEQVLLDQDGVRVVRINHLNGLQSVHQYIRRYYSSAWPHYAHLRPQMSIEETFELRPVSSSSAFKVSHLNRPVLSRSDCTQQSCFDLYQCETADNRLRVYIYPIRRILNYSDDRPMIGEFSREYYQVLQSLQNSPFYTNDISQACAFIIPIDTLNEAHYARFGLDSLSSLLTEYAYFRKYNGSNHLFFNFIGGRNGRMNLQLGNAMLLSAGLNTFHHRHEFDIALPAYSPRSSRFTNRTAFEPHINEMMHKHRPIQVLLVNANLVAGKTKQLLQQIHTKTPNLIVSFSACDNITEDATDRQCNQVMDQQFNYDELLSSANFCLICRSSKETVKPILSEALMFGCIPILIDNWLVPPFESKINWPRISLRVHDAHLPNLSAILDSIHSDRLYGMRRDGLVTWAKYLSTIDRIVQTSLILLNERLFPQTVISKDRWNDLDLRFDPIGCYRLSAGFEQNRCFEQNAFDDQWDLVDATLSDTVGSRQGFTAVILTYDRLESLLQVIAQVMQAPSLLKIVVIWNHQQKRPPPHDELLQMISSTTHKALRVPIDVIVTIENRLSNRFYPFKEIDSDCVLSIDDDITMLNGDELEFGYQIWREFPDRIVGFPSRLHKFDNSSGRWKYDSEWLNEMSMVLTGAAFYHKVTKTIIETCIEIKIGQTYSISPLLSVQYYDYLYTYQMPARIRDWVDEHMNCEDIAMNFLVSNVTGKAPIKVTPRKKFKCPECVNQPMLSSDAKSHLAERSDCINLFAQIYGQIPLKLVEFRVDPLLFKDNLPEKLKKYNHIGSI